MTTVQISTQVVLLNCSVCAGPIALAPFQNESFKQNHKTFYCPIGHTQYYPAKSEADKLRDQLAEAQFQVRRTEAARDNANGLLDAETKKRRKLEKRIHNGVCPRCRRSFVNLQRHMAGQHP